MWARPATVRRQNDVYLALAVALGCRLVRADERFTTALAGDPVAAHVLVARATEQFN